MGIAIVLLLYLVVLSLAALISSVVLGTIAFAYLRTVPRRRTRMTAIAALFPFACVMYAGIWFAAYALINDAVFHHDPMLGDSWYTDIGNGYAVDMIDVSDQGIVHPAQGADRGLDSPEGLSGVRRLQIAGTEIFGSQDLHGFEHLGQSSNEESNFFAIDTKTHRKTDFKTEAELAYYATQHGVALSLEPIESVYRRFRMNWFEPVAGMFLVFPPALVFLWLARRVVLLKKQVHEVPGSASDISAEIT